MTGVTRFLLYNMLPALVAGGVAWALVHAGVRLLGIRHGKLRLCLYMAPLVKSTLVMAGMALVLRWPREVFESWHAGALPPQTVAPILVVLTGLALIGRGVAVRRSRRALLASASPANQVSPPLAEAYGRVLRAFEERGAHRLGDCDWVPELPAPRLMVVDADLRTPAVVLGARPTIVFPRGLVDRLEEGELDAVLAHELAHVYVRAPLSCLSAEAVRAVTMINPVAALMAVQLHREEEKACDDIAVAATGNADRYAATLLECYRYANESTGLMAGRLQHVPQLLGVRPMLSERIERLVSGRGPAENLSRQLISFALLWTLLWVLVFSA
ncbi:MAG TPA: M56 family metallopeptidase [Acidobacteriota bacterium]|nr:M56 family metallopeptidase [Acidobacteriota bacterium]